MRHVPAWRGKPIASSLLEMPSMHPAPSSIPPRSSRPTRPSRGPGYAPAGALARSLAIAALGGPVPMAAQAPQYPPVLTLTEVIERALVTDPAAVQASTSVSLAEADQLQARGSLLPTITSSFTFANSSNERFDQTTGQLVSQNYAAQLQANYELFGGGRRILQMRSAGAGVNAADAALRAQRFQTILDATASYFAAAAANDLLRAAEGRLGRARQQLAFAETRLEVGNATSSDVLRAELEMSNAELAVLQSRTALEAARLRLGRLAGLEGEISPSSDALPDRAPALPGEDELVARALLTSPEVVASRAQVNAARSDRLSAWTGYVPSVRFIGGYDWFSFQFPPGRRSWALRLVASFPIFNGFQRETGITRANAQLRVAEARAADAGRAVRTLLRTAYRAVRTREREVEIADRGVQLASEDLRVQEDRYQLGVANIVDLQTSQLALTDAEAAAVVARQALGTSIAELEAILGEDLRS